MTLKNIFFHENIIPMARRLIKQDYSVYISRTKIQEKQWIRLRVGFFQTKALADREGKKIMATLHLVDSWTTKIGKKEREEFGGY